MWKVWMTIFIVVIVALWALKMFLAIKEGKAKANQVEREKPQRKAVLTPNEQAMYNRLNQALPDLIVLAQVSFGALLNAKNQTTRNTFDRKIADFVVCDRAFQVLAVIELDDSSHKGKEVQDASRDSMLTQTGYRVVRYQQIPDIDQVQRDLQSHDTACDVKSTPPAQQPGSRQTGRQRLRPGGVQAGNKA